MFILVASLTKKKKSCLAGQTIFWTDVQSDVINRAFWNGSNQQTLVADDLESPAGIAAFYIYASFARSFSFLFAFSPLF